MTGKGLLLCVYVCVCVRVYGKGGVGIDRKGSDDALFEIDSAVRELAEGSSLLELCVGVKQIRYMSPVARADIRAAIPMGRCLDVNSPAASSAFWIKGQPHHSYSSSSPLPVKCRLT